MHTGYSVNVCQTRLYILREINTQGETIAKFVSSDWLLEIPSEKDSTCLPLGKLKKTDVLNALNICLVNTMFNAKSGCQQNILKIG